MLANSPEESCHFLDFEGLKAPGVTFWSIHCGPDLAGCGALKRLDRRHGEIKSMRVADAFLGRGAGRAMLDHIVSEARRRGMRKLWLETGSADAFVPALKLYESAGFEVCGPFADYTLDPFSVFMARAL